MTSIIPWIPSAARAVDPLLAYAAAGFSLCGVLLVPWLARASALVGGEHPALKPLRFSFSIAVFLGTMAWIAPRVEASHASKRMIALVLVGTMVLEHVVIVGQALRGTRSHFNAHTPLDRALWGSMALAITAATLCMIALACVATAGPLAMPAPLALAVRAALWLFMLTAISGYSMGGRGAHSVGGADGGAGIALFRWSTTHGDLRVSHFLSQHALQALPVIAWLLGRTTLAPRAQWSLVALSSAGYGALSLFTLLRAWAGRPL